MTAEIAIVFMLYLLGELKIVTRFIYESFINRYMYLPNYADGSIVNLMSSIKKALGGKHSYKELKILPSKNIKDSKNVVLLIIDGLGYLYLKEHLKGTIFEDGLKDKLTSVFPPTTASAITTFATGLSPSEHAFTGWFMHLKELGVVSTILPFNPRIGGSAFSSNDINISDILRCRGFTKDLKISSYLITHNKIKNSDFTKYTAEKSRILGYKSLQGFFKQVRKAIKTHNRKKFIYGYWPELDSIAHEKGINSKQARKHFSEICSELTKLLKSMNGTNTKVIITADHGLIDTTKERLINLEDHPDMLDCLSLPLCGEPRAAYCYVHPSKAKKFEKIC